MKASNVTVSTEQTAAQSMRAIKRRGVFPFIVVLLLPEPHLHIVRAGLGASFAHPIGVAGPAGVAGGIDIGTIVRRCHDWHAIAVDVDVGRGRSAPGETHRIYPSHLASRGAERDRWRTSLRAVSPAGVHNA